MIKIKKFYKQPSIRRYPNSFGIFISGQIVYLDKNAELVHNGSMVIGVVCGVQNNDVFCFQGDGIIETDYYVGGITYIIGQELGVSPYNEWIPNNVLNIKSNIYGKCLGINGNVMQIETYFGSLACPVVPPIIGIDEVFSSGEKIYSGGVCKSCGIYNEYQDVEYVCWSCSSSAE